jgi:ribose/xylose/arabinose/galactoside ABC-type transport system permease subunit
VLAVGFAILFGAGAGLVNAFLVNVLNIMSFIATIGMSSVWMGIGYVATGARAVPVPESFWALGTYRLFNIIPLPFIIMLLLYLIYGGVLTQTGMGRKIYMSGGNRASSRLCGLNPKKISTFLFINSGAIAGFAGAILAARMHNANPNAAATASLDAITAAVLGGVSFVGGVGGMGGCFFGLLLINAFSNGLTGVNLPTYWQLVAQGALLICALGVDYLGSRKRTGIIKPIKE